MLSVCINSMSQILLIISECGISFIVSDADVNMGFWDVHFIGCYKSTLINIYIYLQCYMEVQPYPWNKTLKFSKLARGSFSTPGDPIRFTIKTC